MTNKEALEILDHNWTRLVNSDYTDTELGQALDLAIKALEKDKCSSCKHYDKDYGETCLNPSGTCRVFEYDGYEEVHNARK